MRMEEAGALTFRITARLMLRVIRAFFDNFILHLD